MKRVIKSPVGTEITAKSWLTEAPLRMLMNNLDPEVAERPEDLVVYGGIGKAARNAGCRLESDREALASQWFRDRLLGLLHSASVPGGRHRLPSGATVGRGGTVNAR